MVDFGGIVEWFVVMLPQGRDFQAVKLEIGGPESMTAFSRNLGYHI